MELGQDIRIKKHGLTDAYNGIINKDLFSFEDIEKAQAMATNKMNKLSKHSYEIVDSNVRSFYKYPVSLIIEEGTLKFHTIAHIPIFSPESVFTFYKFHSHPISYGGRTLEFIPKNTLLAKNKLGQFKEFSEHILNGKTCKFFKGRNFWACPDMKILSNDYKKTGSCLMALYENDFSAAADYCQKQQTENHEIVYQTGKNQYKVVNPADNDDKDKPPSAKITCPNSNFKNHWVYHNEILKKNGATTVILDEGCTMDLPGTHVLPSEHFESKVDAPLYELKAKEISENVFDELLKKSLKQANHTHANIEKMEKGTFQDVDINFAQNGWMLPVLITIIVMFVVFAVFIILFYCLYQNKDKKKSYTDS